MRRGLGGRRWIVVACAVAALGVGRRAAAYGTGAGSCDYPGGAMVLGSRSGSGGFSITASGAAWYPGEPLVITLAGPRAFKGFLLQAVAGAPGVPDSGAVGSMSAPAATQLKACTGGNGVTHTSAFTAPPRATVEIPWTAPASGTGPITFHAVVVVSLGEWYGQQTLITLTLPRGTPTDCVVSDWSAWGECDVLCGAGAQARTRTVQTMPAHGGAACPALQETQACDAGPCEQDCAVGEWGAWSTCSAACGGGTRTRTRAITLEQRGSGAACPALEESESCNTQDCPVDCVVGEWTDWGACEGNCGLVEKRRTRPILVAPAGDGAPCPATEEVTTCRLPRCPNDCDHREDISWSGTVGAEPLVLEVCGAKVEVPPEAADAGTEVTFTRLEPLPGIAETRYRLDPVQAAFAAPVTLTLPLEAAYARPAIEGCDVDFVKCALLESRVEGNGVVGDTLAGGVFKVRNAPPPPAPDAGTPVEEPEPVGCGCGAGGALTGGGALLVVAGLRRRRRTAR